VKTLGTFNWRIGWWIIIFIMFLTPLFSNSQALGQQGSTFSLDYIPITPWCSYYKSGMLGVAQANFTTGGFFVDSQDLSHLDLLGLNAILPSGLPDNSIALSGLTDQEITAQVASAVATTYNDPRVLGYHIADEPSAVGFHALGVAVEAVKTYAPGKLAYINLFPNYATPAQLGTATYTEYLETFVSEVNPQILSYDNYDGQYELNSSYFTNLVEARRVAVENDIPLWNFLASCKVGSAIPTRENLSLQAYTSLAAGSKGISWFRYYDGAFSDAPVDHPAFDTKQPAWYLIKDVNQEISILAPTMVDLESTGVYFTQPTPDASSPELPGSIIQSILSDEPLMVGEFIHENGEDYAMIVNLDMDSDATISVTRAAYYLDINIVSSLTGELIPANLSNYLLAPGQGVLVKFGTAMLFPMGDANHDGVVSAGDYAAVQANFGNTLQTQSASTPEPMTMSLLGIGGGALMSRRRRR
jgi:hypothetical protein